MSPRRQAARLPLRAPTRVLITGASGEIGGALALAYAAPGVTLVLHGRRGERLAALAADCRARGAQVLACEADLADLDGWRQTLTGLCTPVAPDLVVVAAGINISVPPGACSEGWEKMRHLLDVNVLAAIATVEVAARAMCARGQGQIALVSSLAAFRGLPRVPAYSASKAALKAYGEAMRDVLAPKGVSLSVVMPGYVVSPMCAAMPGPKPFLWDAPRAARAIRRGLRANRGRIVFPFWLGWGTWLLGVAPPWLASRVLRWLGYGA